MSCVCVYDLFLFLQVEGQGEVAQGDVLAAREVGPPVQEGAEAATAKDKLVAYLQKKNKQAVVVVEEEQGGGSGSVGERGVKPPRAAQKSIAAQVTTHIHTHTYK